MQNFASPLRRTCKDIPRFFGRTNGLNSSLRFNSTQVDAAKQLNWPEYFEIRRRRRQWQTVFTIPCALVGFFGGSFYFGSLATDPTKPIMGVDPMIFYGGCTVLCMGAGYVVGPSLGSTAWRVMNRKVVPQIDALDREFYKHVAKNRVAAELQSATNPVPDYYGEKVGSLKQYRQWLRDQAKYRRKAVLPEE
ncbi:mitochondrial import protein Pam17 [Mycena albidolilacea]|uniref:Presequence translocated-associated motor subunit PAM17 n=1 Tax=Mycena albidolilacea TaxID=1033008 RepID=A0AAD7EZC2_9AGAR|nr:mitochondrial import protein Pam17 [Mycena albidolilacea]